MRPYRVANLIISLVILIVLCGLCIFTPFGSKRGDNWDRVAYTALVFRSQNHDISETRSLTYNALRRELDSVTFLQLTGQDPTGKKVADDYRYTCFTDSTALGEQLNFYSGRFMYIESIALLHRIGFDFSTSFLILSLVPACIILLILSWYIATLDNRLLCLIGPIFALGLLVFSRIPFWSTPDALVALCSVVGLVLILLNHHFHLAFSMFLLSILFKVDNIVFVEIVMISMILSKEYPQNVKTIGAWILLYGGSYLILNSITKPYALSTLLYHSTVRLILYPQQTAITWSVAQHVLALKSSMSKLLFAIAPFIGLVLMGLFINRRNKLPRIEVMLISIGLASAITRFAILPHVENRYYFSSMLCLILAACRIYTIKDDQLPTSRITPNPVGVS